MNADLKAPSFPDLAPLAPDQRIEALDVVRGLSLIHI